MSFALIDCNNFFVSCERAFRPDLENKPVVVLSNNDGCVVSRSQEVKGLGIPMGAPYFKCRDIIEKYGITVFSSNFELYGDMSDRVMTTLDTFADDVEFYSIDEAFVQLPDSTAEAFAHTIRSTIRQWTRIPVSVGIGPTKVLAKLASHIAKQNPALNGVFTISKNTPDSYLAELPVGEIWGIGRKSVELLNKNRITTALDFKNTPDDWVRKKLSITGLYILNELRGIPCFKLDDNPAPKKGITCSRSFGTPVTQLAELEEAVATYTARAVEKLRSEHETAGYIRVYIRTNYFNLDSKYIAGKGVTLPVRTAFTPHLIKEALMLLKHIYKEGFRYYKAGVSLSDLGPEGTTQQNLFVHHDAQKEKRLMQGVDLLNTRYGADTVRYAAMGTDHRWHMKRDHVSPHYTTSFNDLPLVR